MSTSTSSSAAPRQLTRSRQYKMIAGVCGGVAEYMDVDPTVARVVYVLFTVLSAILPGVLAYIVLAFLMPPPGSPPK